MNCAASGQVECLIGRSRYRGGKQPYPKNGWWIASRLERAKKPLFIWGATFIGV